MSSTLSSGYSTCVWPCFAVIPWGRGDNFGKEVEAHEKSCQAWKTHIEKMKKNYKDESINTDND